MMIPVMPIPYYPGYLFSILVIRSLCLGLEPVIVRKTGSHFSSVSVRKTHQEGTEMWGE